jgi:hypothetical protein
VVARNAKNPGSELCVGSEPFDVLVHGKKDLLREIKSLFFIGEHPNAEVVHAVLMQSNDCFERPRLMTAQSGEQDAV